MHYANTSLNHLKSLEEDGLIIVSKRFLVELRIFNKRCEYVALVSLHCFYLLLMKIQMLMQQRSNEDVIDFSG